MIKTLVAGNVHFTEQQKTELNDQGFELVFHPDEREPVLGPEQYEAVICNGLFQFHDIDQFRVLRVIQLTSAGMDRIPLERIKEKGITVFNAEDTYSIPMAEFTVGGILQLYKNTDFFLQNKKDHNWEKDRNLRELLGKKVLIIGTGNVGQAVAKRLASFDCEITGLSKSGVSTPYFNKTDHVSNMDDYLPATDILVLAAPHTSETTGIINTSRLRLLQDDAIVVNVARGGLMEEDALIQWLQTHPTGGAVLDVFRTEPLPMESPLWEMPHVILSPHNSFVGEGNSERLFHVIEKNLNYYYHL